jgi:hypothetical protein
VSRSSQKVVLRVKTESEYQEDQLEAFEAGLHHSETHALVERIDNNAGRFTSCRRHPQTVPKAESGYLAPPRLLDTESESSLSPSPP